MSVGYVPVFVTVVSHEFHRCLLCGFHICIDLVQVLCVQVVVLRWWNLVCACFVLNSPSLGGSGCSPWNWKTILIHFISSPTVNFKAAASVSLFPVCEGQVKHFCPIVCISPVASIHCLIRVLSPVVNRIFWPPLLCCLYLLCFQCMSALLGCHWVAAELWLRDEEALANMNHKRNSSYLSRGQTSQTTDTNRSTQERKTQHYIPMSHKRNGWRSLA